jgi:hypothetical protein
MEEHILIFVELAAGVIIGFVVWSYVSPMITSVGVTPSA